MNRRFTNPGVKRSAAKSAVIRGGLVLMAALLFAACQNPTDGKTDEAEEYTVTPAATSNGRIIPVPPKAAPGTEITLVLIPNVYYSLAAAPQATANGSAVPLTKKEETEPYTFAMPASDVTVSANFIVNPSHNVIPLYSAADLAKIGSNEAYAMNGVYQLEADFAVTDWTPIGEFPTKPFTGILRGNNHAITINSFSAEGLGKQAVGLFGYTAFAAMENLNITSNFSADSVLTYDNGGTASAAAVVGYGSAAGISLNIIAKNITVRGSTDIVFSSSVPLSIGGIIGWMHSGKIEDCVVGEMEIEAENSANNIIAGGILGQAYNFNSTYYSFSSGVLIDKCNFAGAIKIKSGNSYAGGILGHNNHLNVTIQQCNVADGISIESERTTDGTSSNSSALAGGIVGQISATTSSESLSAIQDCTVGEGLIKAVGWQASYIYAGGIAAALAASNGGISGCTSAANVEAVSNGPNSNTTLDIMAGGIVGNNTGISDMAITKCRSSGDILAQNAGTTTVSNRIIAGGIAGTNTGAISNCYATGSVDGLLTGTAASSSSRFDLVNAGGITGRVDTTGSISNCYYMGDEINAMGNYATAGGIAAVATGKATIENCYALGKISVEGGGGKMTPSPYSAYNIGKNYSAGGIAGHLNATNATNVPIAKNCVALNSALTVEGAEDELIWVKRIIGNIQGTANPANSPDPGKSSTFENNLANSAMTIKKAITGGVTIGPATVVDDGVTPENTVNGLGVSLPLAQTAYTDLGWDFATVWKMGSDGYPVLAWQN